MSKLLCKRAPEEPQPSAPSLLFPASITAGGWRYPRPAAPGCESSRATPGRPWRSGAAARAWGNSRAGPAGMPGQDLPRAAISCRAHGGRQPRRAARGRPGTGAAAGRAVPLRRARGRRRLPPRESRAELRPAAAPAARAGPELSHAGPR